MSKQPRNAGVAIVGIGCRFPGADDPGEFLANLTDGVDAVREIPADRFDTSRLYDPDRSAEGRSVSKWCGLVERPYDFDHQFFRIAPREARLLDPLQRLLMEVTQACVEDAGTTVAALGASRTSVYIGNMERDHMAELTSPGHTVESHSVLGVYDCLLANRLSQVFGLGGASMAVDAACASSLVAVHLGMQALATGEADHVLAGGVNLNLHPWKYVGFSKSRMLSPTGRCRTFDRDADGFVPGDGVGMVLLRRLEDAVRDGDHIYGVLRGSAVNHGRRRATITAPTVASQREVVSEAVARAGVSPADITFVETHGTGTSLGDPIEVEALRQVFAPASDGVGWCTLGAVKSNIGHLEGAAGVAGLIKVLMMMSERRIVPNLHLRTLNPLIRLAGSPFRLAAENTPWRPSAPGRPRLAGVSSFGFGGVNAHLVVEEYVPATRPPQPVRPLPFLLSAASASSLEKLTGQWRRSAPQGALPDVCTTLAVGRTQLPHRIGGVVTGSEDIAALLAAGEESAVAPEGPWALRVGLLEVPDDVEAFVSAYARVLDAPVADLLRTAEVGGARQRFAYTTAVVSALLRLGLTPDRVLASGPGVWPALAALGALDAGTAADLADGRAVHGTLRAPSLPLAVPGTDRVVVPFALDTAYLADLRGAAVDGTELAGLAELAGRLDAQRTYQHNVADWRRALRERGYVDELVERAEAVEPVESVGATGPDGTTGPAGAADPRVAALAWQNALDRLSRKWGLPLDRQLADARAVELLDLLLDGVVEPGDVIGLLAGESVAPRRPERAEMADQNRYPVLRGRSGLPDELAGVEAWVGFADAAGDAVGPAGSAGSGGVVPEGHSVVSVGEAAGDVRVVSGADPLTEPLTELWRRGVDVRWADHPVATAGVRTPLPTTRFDSVEHRVPSAVEAVPPDAPGVPAAAVPRAAGAEAAGGAVGQQPAVAAAAVGESAVGGTVIEESAVEESVVELRAEWEATGRVAAPAVASVLVLGVSGADVGRLAAACLPGRVRTVEQAALPGADDLAGWRRTLGDGTPPDAVVLCCTGSATDTAVAALRVTHAVYGRGTRVLAVGPLVGGAVSPELAALTGLARSLARETRSVPFRAMAVAGGLDTRAAWESVADELGRSDGTELVRYAEDGRLTRRYVPAPPSPATPGVPGVRPGGVYLLTGGTGGVGQLVAEHLLSVPGVRVAVVGRSPASQEDGRERIAHFVADVSDAEQARTVVRRVRERFGALTGVLHAAGVLRDGYLAQKSADDLRAVFAPKVLGAVNLDRATRDEPLEMFVLFSSMVASVGNPGQADYAAANAFLDQFAEVRETLRAVGERSGRSLSIGWPVWRDGGMTVTDRGVLGPGAGVLPMPTATALAVLDRLLAGATGARPFVHGVPHRVPELLDPVPAPGTPAAAPNGPGGPDAGPAPEADRAQLVAWAKEHVADVIGELRGVAATDVDLGRSLDQYGLDSIVISEFNARTEARIGSVGETLLFESRTLAAAAERIAQLRPTELTALYGAADAPVGESDAEVVGASSGEVTEGAGSRSADVAYDDTTAYDDIADDDVAVIGLAGRYPHAPDLDSFWDNLLRGRDSVARVPRSRWTPSSGTYCEEGAFLDDVYAFDPLFFNISPRDAELMDPQERLFLQTAWHAFEDAGYPPGRLGDPGVPGARSVGVFVGVTTQTHLLWGPEQQRAGHPVVPPSPQWSVANRVSYWLDLHGPSMPVDTACASSLTAVHLAARSMARGECRMALVGGVNLYLHPAKYDWLCSLQMLSRTGRCHTFGAGADGFVPGEGVGAALLKPLRAALADGDPIYGVIRGSAVNHGGRTNGYTVPSPLAQAEVVSAALARARVAPATVGYIEAHGTGTALGDPVEIAGLARAFAGVPAGSCRIGSVKTNVGHLESAAGMAGLTKVLLQLESGTLVPSLHSTEPNPRIDFAATPFTVQREVADWPGAGPNGAPRRAGISAFGAGGANAHVVVEEAPRRRWPRGAEHGEHLVVVSAYDRERLAEHCANLSGAIRARADELRVSEIAYQLQVRREPQAERLALLVGDARELADRLAEFAAGREPAGEHWTTVRDRATRTRLREGLPQALARRHWAALAGAWVAGAEVAWESLHDAPGPHVRLPGYPFAREQCRLPEVPPATATVAAASTAVTAPPGGRAAVHPWVREPSGEGGTVELTCDEAAVAQHTVDGTPVFPAAGCVELVRAAARAEVGAGRLVRLRNNVWSAPISVPEPRTLRVSLSGGDPGDYEITGPEGTHVRGKVETAPAEDLPPLDVAAIRARCARTTSGQSLYAAVRARGLDLGPFYQGVERLHWNEGGDEALAELRLPDGGDGGDGGLVLHPGLLDSAFQSSLWLLGQRFDGLYLPFSIGTVEILGELPAVAVAHVVVRRASAEGCKLEVRLADTSGRVVLRALDFWVRARPGGPAWSRFCPAWVAQEAGAVRVPQSAVNVPGSALILAPTDEAGARLGAELSRQAGAPVPVTVAVPRRDGSGAGPLRPRPDSDADFDALLAAAGPVDTVLFAWPRAAKGGVEAQLADGLLPLSRLVRALLRSGDNGQVRLVCAVADRVPGYQALGGFLRTLTRESPRVSHVLVAGATAEQLVAETLGAAAGVEVRHRDGVRAVRRWRRSPVEAAAASAAPAPTPVPAASVPAVRDGGVYLITGGAGGLGALVAEWLAKSAGARVVLAGRSAEDERVTRVLDRVRAAGGQACYVRADVSTAEGARSAVRASWAAFGAPHGVFHCAGVLRDGYLVHQDPERLRDVVAAKAIGAVHLDAALADHTPDFLCLFSSVAAAVGSAGQAGYAYANAFLDAFAEQRLGRTLSIAWPLWADGGMGVDAEAAETLRMAFGLRPLATGTGLAALAAELAGDDRQSLIVPGDGAVLARVLDARDGLDGLNATAGAEEHPAAAADDFADTGVDADAVAEAVAEVVVGEMAAVVKLDPLRIDRERPIGDYGFDSLSFTTLANRLVERLGVDFNPALFFEYTTVEDVARHIADAHGAHVAARLSPARPESPKSPESPEPAATAAPAATGTRTSPSRPPASPASLASPAPSVSRADEPVAIIGMHGMLPGSSDLAEFWRNLGAGRDMVTEIPADRWDWRAYYHSTAGPGRTNSKWGGFVPQVDRFDARFFGISPREAELMDPQQRLFLEAAYKTVEEAGYRPSDLAKGRTGLFVGAASHDYYELLREAGVPVEAFTTTGMFHAILANRVSYLLGLTGPSLPIDTACSSSLVALRSAVESIRAGSCDTALVGGVNLLLSPTVFISFARAGMLSPTGRCRTFDAGADGYVRAEGVGALLLKPLSAAERDGDHIHAVVRGSAVNHGGKVNTLTTPNPKAQADLIVRAFGEADVDPATVGYLELHGTGTALGDPIEVNGVQRAFAELRDRAGLPPLTAPTTLIGSVKSNIGHLEAAAGLAGIFKVVLSMKHGQIPGNLHLEEVNGQIGLAGSPLSIVDRTMPWPRPQADDGTELPRRAGVSSFGFGGVNGHVLLEEYVAAPADSATTGPQVFVVSARDRERLRAYAGLLARAVRPFDGPRRNAGPEPTAEATAAEAAAAEVTAAELIAAEVAAGLGVDPGDVPWDEPLADLGMSPHRALLLADRLDPAVLPGRRPEALTALTVTELAELAQPAARTSTGADTGTGTDPVGLPSPAGPLADIAYTLQTGREPMAHRLAVVTSSAAELADELAEFAASGTPGPLTRTGVAEGGRGPAAVGGAHELAEGWVTGGTADWAALHAGRSPRRLSLPTYPFARDRHWIPGSAAPGPRPLLEGPGTPDGDGTLYRARLERGDRFVAEHRVHGAPVLAGVVQAELAAAALAAHGGGPRRLTRLAWLRPLVVPEEGCEVLVRLTERDGGIAHELRTADGTVHSTGLWVVGDGAAGTPAPCDLAAVRGRCAEERAREDIYAVFEGIGIRYGELFRGLRHAVVGEGELLARFTAEVSPPYLPTFHPTVLDAALQAVTVLTGAEPGTTRLPFEVESVELLAPVPTTGHVHVRARGGAGHDVTVLDDAGRPCVLLLGVFVREQRQPGLFYRPCWRPAEPVTADSVSAGPVSADPVRGPALIVRSAGSVALADALAARHQGPVHVLDVAEVARPGLAERLRGLGEVRHLWFLALEAEPGEGAQALFRLVRGLAEADLIQRVRSVRSVTSGAQDVWGGRVTDPVAAELTGMSKSLAKEYPRIGVGCVELAGPATGAARAADALLADPLRQDDREVALWGGHRLVRVLRPLHLPPPARQVFREGGSYLIVGGAGGIGLALAEHLTQSVSARIFLVGRRPQDERIERALAGLGRLGGQVTYHQADVTNLDAMRALAAKVRAHGPLHGVVHAAMVLRDGIVERTSEEAFDAVLAPKTDGMRVLGEVFAGDPLDFLLVLSSVQSFTGAAGQANYAAASTAQDAYAHLLAAGSPFPVQHIGFGPWARVGRVADRHESLSARGYRPIEPAEGIDAIERVLAAGERGVVALRADEPVLAAIGAEHGAAAPVPPAVPAHDTDPAEQEALDAFVGQALWHVLGGLGLFTRPGERHLVDNLPELLGARPRHRRLVTALTQVLVRGGHLVRDGAAVALPATGARRAAPDPAPLRARFPHLGARLELVVRCLDALPEVLTGAREATEVVFPGGSPDLVTAVYRGEPLVDYCNALVAGQVVAHAENGVRAGDGVRVLEIGAGTGSTTEAVLAALTEVGRPVEYDVSDISLGLLRQVRARLTGPGVRFRSLDVERPADAQGFAGELYDVVVAGNVLHATRDLDAALERVRGLLAPGGRLVLSEVTVVQPFHTVTFGLLDGWWRFDDARRRLPGSPLLDPHMWRDRLERADFTDVAVLGAPDGPGVLPQRVIVATAADRRPSSAVREVPRSASVAPETSVAPVAPVAPVATGPVVTEPEVAGRGGAQLRALVTERVAGCLGVPVGDVGPDTSLSDLGIDSIVAVELTNQLNDALGVVLKTLVVFEHPTVDALTAHLVERYGETPAPDPVPGPAPVSTPVPGPAPAPAPGAGVRGAGGLRAVRFERPGSPQGLRIVPMEPVAPGPGEIEVHVRAFPINFSDFLLAKGLYPMMPDFPFTPGVEVSGVVRRVGPGVTRFSPGDEVIALTRPEMGGQASVVLTGEDFAVAKPPQVSHEAACGFLVPFLAMHLAFERAGVRAGERVLVPAATGTTGLIAVRLAQLAGAEVIATAGGEHKIAHLAGLGVQEAIDHRRADVVGEVLRRTGGVGVDVVVNTLGDGAAQQGIDVLAPDGRYVEIAVFGLQASTGPDLSRLVDNQSFHSFNTKKFFLRHPERRAEVLRTAAEHLASGRVTPTVAHVLPFDRIAEAYALKEDRALIGRVVVTVPEPGEVSGAGEGSGLGGDCGPGAPSVSERLRAVLAREFGAHTVPGDADLARLAEQLGAGHQEAGPSAP